MTGILLIVQIVLVVMIVIAVLLQKSSSIGLGAYSGSNESVFGAKGPASFLAKVTLSLILLLWAIFTLSKKMRLWLILCWTKLTSAHQQSMSFMTSTSPNKRKAIYAKRNLSIL